MKRVTHSLLVSTVLAGFVAFAAGTAGASTTAAGQTYYVAPGGSDSAAGTQAAPWASIAHAQSVAQPGDTVYFRGGTYAYSHANSSCASPTARVDAITLSKSGSAGSPIRYWAYPGEQPVFDFSGMTSDNCRIKGFDVTGNNIHVRGLDVTGVRQNNYLNHESWGIWVSGSDNTFEQINAYQNMGPGLFIQNGGGNLVLNSDSHDNYDPLTSNGAGESADGFGAHISANFPGNVFRGCRAWNNSDDGFDLINAFSPVLIESSWSWHNGYVPGTNTTAGNGNGFKMGGYGGGYVSNGAKHTIRFSVAFANRAAGFYANHHTLANDYFDNTGYANHPDFNMLGVDSSGNATGIGNLRNNIAYGGTLTSNMGGTNAAANSWNLNVPLSDAQFQSVATTGWDAPRQADGSLPVLPNLRLAATSALIDKGVDVGLPYAGSAPDLGAFETAPPSSASPSVAAARTVTPFDQSWLFDYGDASGAQAPSYGDSGWRHVDVPHDWSIEGAHPPANPFSASAPSTGRGGYLPSGVGWYRKHFALSVASTRKVFIEFDGVMANASVYVNGTLIGTHPYGYTSFRYDITAAVKFGGADNVLAVRTDTSQQPAERFYTGAGIYRDVRLIATDPVHVDQWATDVTTPQATTSSATVHVQTTVINSGGTAASVSVQGVLSDPSGAALPAVTTAARTIAAGASASFAYDVPVSGPRLWDLQHPNLYSLVTNVLAGGAVVDNDTTPVGIRSLTFSPSTGMSLNGKTVKFQGVALHQDYHGLGMAVPQRAMQRRLAQLKALGVNAIRTAHDPPSPAFLQLTDKMGFLVLDEFFDVWTKHKYSDVGDYATYFNRTASAPTGAPAVPGASGSVPWYQADATSIVMRDRNHPSVAMWSTGNEIRDSLATRTPLLTRMVAIAHALDPGRPVTQALFRPGDNGDVTGATRTTLDVFGGNYRPDDVIKAAGTAPARPGLFTEMGTATSSWATVTANPPITGEFLWTGADYLGEADGLWPSVQVTFGLMDAVGTVRPIGYSWQKVWGAPVTTPPATGSTATKLVVAADHATVSTDENDVSYVKVTVADSAGRVVTSSSAPVTFGISGPGTIIAVDSGSQTQETFRGSTRKAYQGITYALVRATGPGTITVTASTGGLTSGTTTLTGTTTPFVPCTNTCD